MPGREPYDRAPTPSEKPPHAPRRWLSALRGPISLTQNRGRLAGSLAAIVVLLGGGGWYALSSPSLVRASAAGPEPPRHTSQAIPTSAGTTTTTTDPTTTAAPTTTTGAPTTTTPTTTTTLPPSAEPMGGTTLFPGYRIVAFYGAAGAPSMGVLGSAPPAALWSRLIAQSAPYAQAGIHVLPAYELITYVTQASPGPAGTYSERIANQTISSYLSVVQAHHGLLILDIQPGRGSFLSDAETLAPYLTQPDVALALDPEWKLYGNQIPDVQIGHTTAASINAVSAWLEHLVVAHNLPQKLLLIHQFTTNMVADKAAVAPQAHLGIVFNMDGFGSPAVKASTYGQLAADPRFPLGYKLFYRQDSNMLSPAQVLALHPTPSIVEYQ